MANKNITYKHLRTVQNTGFHSHIYCLKQHKEARASWRSRGFRTFIAELWPYKFWLVVAAGHIDQTRLIAPCVWNINNSLAYGLSVPEGTQVIGYKRQADRNRQAKQLWDHVLGWGGGAFVY